MSLRRITRDSRLSPEEAAENREIRKQVAEELPELIARHEERMAALDQLTDLVHQQGEETIIAKSGRPVAKLVRLAAEPRKPGRLKGRIRVGADFDEPLPNEILAAFRGESG
jgi:antitoxin (DNA-binding transcriptional repressor) of toxin-antitoxin stability system